MNRIAMGASFIILLSAKAESRFIHAPPVGGISDYRFQLSRERRNIARRGGKEKGRSANPRGRPFRSDSIKNPAV
jgi:hypothetical protein